MVTNVLLLGSLQWLPLGCAPAQAASPARGVVRVDEGETLWLQDLGGARVRLASRDHGTELRALVDCSVDVTGPRALGRLWVRSYQVITGPDGSAPFVGLLTHRGTRLVVEDPRLTWPMFLNAPDDLAAYVGHRVLVMGYVVGPQELQVVGYRVLSEASPVED